MKPTVILYHADCPDGFGAAWAAWKKFGPRAEYVATEPRELPEGVNLKNCEVYVLDNSLRPAVVKRLERAGSRVVVIDHHESSKRDVLSGNEYVFDLKHSGTVLAWRFFHPKKPVPQLLRYIEDGDLWKFSLPHSDALLSYIYAQAFDFAEWSALARQFETARGRARAGELGKVIGGYDRVLIREIVEKADTVRFGGHTALAVNSSLKRLSSEVGHALVKKLPPIGIVWYEMKGIRHVSLRSNGTADVSKLAAKFGGGGHKAASGFSMPVSKPFPWRRIQR